MFVQLAFSLSWLYSLVKFFNLIFMKKVLAILAVGSILGTVMIAWFAGPASADFSDVDGSLYYYDSVKFLEDEGIIHGNPDGSFGYSFPINRAELLTIVIRAADVELDSAQWIAYGNENCFDDVQEGQWFTQYICYAKDAGWVGGYEDGTFEPESDVNFVEVLKISMEALGIEYTPDTEPWFKGMVESAADKNLIPLTITSFDQVITRGEMADLIARILKYNAGDLDEWLGEKKDCVVTYETIEVGTDMAKLCGGGDDGGDGGDDGGTGLGYGPLFVDWSYTDVPSDHYISTLQDVDELIFYYSNDMFSFEIDGAGQYWYGPLTESDFNTELAEPSDDKLMFDTFNEDETCLGTANEDFHDLIVETSKLAALEIPIFDIELEGEPFTWWMTVFATRNPLGWDIADAQAYLSCAGTVMAPIKLIDNYLYEEEDSGAILWVQECPEKGLEPVMADYCSDMRGIIMSQLNPDLMGDQ